MKRRIFALLLVLLVALSTLFSCTVGQGGTGDSTTAATTETPATNYDYAAMVQLDMSSSTAKQTATVKLYVDGDTTHFNVPTNVAEGGVLKARYLAINTPESTGKVEPYGKQASIFTKEKLSTATSIILESDDENWNLDSTGGRHLVWVWYKTAESDTYRNLNIEILQNGLAIASSSANNRYGETCMAAIAQAKANKLKVYSGQRDPMFYYGTAYELTLKQLRTHIEAYKDAKVAFEGVITANNGQSVYIEEYDPETDLYYGMTIYYGYSMSGDALDILTPGNRVRIVGTVQYYEAGATYQVSGLTYSAMRPNDPENIQKISDGHTPAFAELDVTAFLGKNNVTLTFEPETEDEEQETLTFDYAYLIQNTSVSAGGLTVTHVSTTTNESSSSYGAMTLTCKTADGKTVTVRTVPLYRDGALVTADEFMGKTISVKGFVEYYKSEYNDGVYQIKVISLNHIEVAD